MLRSLKDVWATLSTERKSELLSPPAPVVEEEIVGEKPMMLMSLQSFEEEESDPFDGITIVDPHETNPNVRGPCCRRVKALDNLLDLTPIPEAQRAAMLATAGFPLLNAICGTCIGRLMRSGVKRSDLYEAVGAPATIVNKLRASE